MLGCLPLRKERMFKVIKLSDLPHSCYTDSSVCGDFLTQKCLLREVLKYGRLI
ncbi:hypothetical protein [Archaeoglobus profundus]|uniref:Uncharacterized protein n=1 Tax=Archaeoglobus profundus (strain DSM 5631 / JCM 9629 / NBRC 100127 / Av18) TaxID=572546 RepID=D2REW6_ARCPA|nr:hypothetical protein [Archaeoglobus profundus]ADB58660.1 hypothetical protein Arcpr_1614 [Archaeoglobus profundus DSM 5631]